MNSKANIRDTVIEQGSNNPYVDLGARDPEAMLVKAKLAHQIAQIIKGRHLTQQRAAAILGMTQPKLSGLLRGRFRGISQGKMIDCLNRLGQDVNIVVRKANRSATGHTQVMVA